jgi:hypothetical protein
VDLVLEDWDEIPGALVIDLVAPFLQFFWFELRPDWLCGIVMTHFSVAVETERTGIVLFVGSPILLGYDVVHLNEHIASLFT